jgi:hypothetical protein
MVVGAPARVTSCRRGSQRPAPLAIIDVVTPEAELPSQRGETWNDTEAIDRHREMTPSQRVALAIEASRAALMIAEANRASDDRAQVRT